MKRKAQLELRLTELEERIEMLEVKQNILLEATAKNPRTKKLGGEGIMEIATVCSNCHMPIKRGDFCCRHCQKLLETPISGGEE